MDLTWINRLRVRIFARIDLPAAFDLAIGNPPFSDRSVRSDRTYRSLGLRLHDYFIARSIDLLKPGGLAAFVTSAINEADIERAFGMDPLVEGPLAMCGFGWRAGRLPRLTSAAVACAVRLLQISRPLSTIMLRIRPKKTAKSVSMAFPFRRSRS